MGDVKLAFIVQKPQYKGETSRLAITHAISYQTVEIFDLYTLKDWDCETGAPSRQRLNELGIEWAMDLLEN